MDFVLFHHEFKRPMTVGPDDAIRGQYSFVFEEDGSVKPGPVNAFEVIRGGAKDLVEEPVTNENCLCCWHLGCTCGNRCPFFGDKAVR